MHEEDGRKRRRGLTIAVLAILAWALPTVDATPLFADPDDASWEALKSGGHVALMRHAEAPGTDDPPGFRLDDCATQRNLSDSGRDQARDIGARFRRHGILRAPVYSSRWCRCLETARLLGLGDVKPYPGLNSFFRDSATKERQTAEVRGLIRELREGPSAVLVTHQVNIHALTGVHPGSGEIVVVRLEGEELAVVGHIRQPVAGGTDDKTNP